MTEHEQIAERLAPTQRHTLQRLAAHAPDAGSALSITDVHQMSAISLIGMGLASEIIADGGGRSVFITELGQQVAAVLA